MDVEKKIMEIEAERKLIEQTINKQIEDFVTKNNLDFIYIDVEGKVGEQKIKLGLCFNGYSFRAIQAL